jgi:hypothetical protein
MIEPQPKSPVSPWNRDRGRLLRENSALKEYAKEKSELPRINFQSFSDHITVKAICVVADLPAPDWDDDLPGAVKSATYPYLYFPTDSFKQTYFPPNLAGEGSGDSQMSRIIIASTSASMLLNGVLVRNVGYLNGRTGYVEETEFQKFLISVVPLQK